MTFPFSALELQSGLRQGMPLPAREAPRRPAQRNVRTGHGFRPHIFCVLQRAAWRARVCPSRLGAKRAPHLMLAALLTRPAAIYAATLAAHVRRALRSATSLPAALGACCVAVHAATDVSIVFVVVVFAVVVASAIIVHDLFPSANLETMPKKRHQNMDKNYNFCCCFSSCFCRSYCCCCCFCCYCCQK